MSELQFHVGDRVYIEGGQIVSIGVVKRITPTGRIRVDFGTYEATFNKSGWLLGADIYSGNYIRHLTKEKEEKFANAALIRKCLEKFDHHRKKLTVMQAQEILKILEAEES